MLYKIEERPSDSPLVERIWRARSQSFGVLTSQAATRCEIVFVKYQGENQIILRGPETKASQLPVQRLGIEFLGISFVTGAFMPHLPPRQLLDFRDVNLPAASRQSFWLDSSTWQIPKFENADTFVAKLAQEDILVRDPVVETVLAGRSPDLSRRAVQYRFSQATGLTQSAIQQIERARLAAILLEAGKSILDVVHETGYADQPHSRSRGLHRE